MILCAASALCAQMRSVPMAVSSLSSVTGFVFVFT